MIYPPINTILIPIVLSLTCVGHAITSVQLPLVLANPQAFNPTNYEEEGDYGAIYQKFFWNEDIVVVFRKDSPKERDIYLRTSDTNKIAGNKKILATIQDSNALFEKYNIYLLTSGPFKDKYLVAYFDGEDINSIDVMTANFESKEGIGRARENILTLNGGILPVYRLLNDRARFCITKGIKCFQ